MAEYVSKSTDELLTLMADTYDGTITPKRIFRNNNNKIWLILRGVGAGFSLINDLVVALRNRFDPMNSADSDLYSIGQLSGSLPKLGSGSLITITITNNDLASAKILVAGIYSYTSTAGVKFSFSLDAGLSVASLGTAVVRAISQFVGSYSVTDVASANLVRDDLAVIDPAFTFAVADNIDSLGYPDEDTVSYRSRINTDTDRQDELVEAELAIRNLPSIFECKLLQNTSSGGMTYDGITIDSYQLLVVLLGAPVDEVARQIATRTVYHTKEIDSGNVVYYYDDHYIAGQYPVYFMYFLYQDFSLGIVYRYDSKKILKTNAEDAITTSLQVYEHPTQWTDTLTSNDLFKIMDALALASVRLLSVSMIVSGSPVSSIDALKTRLIRLTDITFTGTDTSV